MKEKRGFTVTELLVVVGILGLIAAFTIPKVISTVSNNQNNVVAKETAKIVQQAYMAYQLDKIPTEGFWLLNLTPYINTLANDGALSAITADSYPTGPTIDCGTWIWECHTLHNGAMLVFSKGMIFLGKYGTESIPFMVDPDGPGGEASESIAFLLHYDGAISTAGNPIPGAIWCTNLHICNPASSPDPSWWQGW